MRKPRAEKSFFNKLTSQTSQIVGSPFGSLLAVTVVILWAITGPIFQFSDRWQGVITTGIAIVNFLMIFLIKNSQNHDSKAVQMKLDELIRAISSAHNEIISVEDSSEEELEKMKKDLSGLGNNSQK